MTIWDKCCGIHIPLGVFYLHVFLQEKEALAMYSLATCYHSLAKESHLSDEPEGEHSRLETTSLIAKAVQHYR